MTEFLFGAFPYAAVLLAVGVGAYRYFSDRFSYTSSSTQFLENRWLFWGSVPWHYGILLVLLAHLLAALFPFTRLVHVFTVPVSYAWRPYLLFFWNRRGPGMAGDGK